MIVAFFQDAKELVDKTAKNKRPKKAEHMTSKNDAIRVSKQF